MWRPGISSISSIVVLRGKWWGSSFGGSYFFLFGKASNLADWASWKFSNQTRPWRRQPILEHSNSLVAGLKYSLSLNARLWGPFICASKRYFLNVWRAVYRHVRLAIWGHICISTEYDWEIAAKIMLDWILQLYTLFKPDHSTPERPAAGQ